MSVRYKAIDDDGYLATDTRPVIKSVYVDNDENSITINSENALIVRWISDGKLIATTKAGDASFDLDDYSDEIGGYVRAEVFGEGGVVYTQSFTVNADDAKDDGDSSYKNYGFMDFLFGLADRYCGLLFRIIRNLFR